jgi:predicted nucleic acid-binding protein
VIHGLDTGFLVAAEVSEHADHAGARLTLSELSKAGDRFALAPQVLAEFLHVVTDPNRFAHPLAMPEARRLAEQWWTARDMERVVADDAAARLFLTWIGQFGLGRKRLLDTMLAATYRMAGIDSLLTTNAGDFTVFGGFRCILPGATTAATR